MKLHDTARVERAVLVQVVHARMDALEAADSLLELGRLADTAGLEVAGQLTQNRDKPDGGTMIGSGKVEDLKTLIEETGANTVVVDNELNAFQAFNLAKALGVRVMDRTEVILKSLRAALVPPKRSSKSNWRKPSSCSRASRSPNRSSASPAAVAAYVRGPGEAT